MEISADYQSYLNSMKNYELMQGRKDFQAPNAENFSAIYSKAQEEDLELSDAKQFLKSLSPSELKTLQNYSGLADSINIDSLSEEGAYNLLLPDKEQYDFDNDGSTEVGIGKRGSLIPQNMPADVRDAYLSAMNSLSDKERLMTSLLTFNPVSLEVRLGGEESSTPSVKMDYQYIKTKVESILNPTGGAYSSEELKESTRTFWSAFESAYKGDKTQETSQETEDEPNSAVEQFLKDLRTKGAAQFLSDLNQEKIDKLVEDFEEKLRESMGNSPEALKEIAQLVEDYKKQLMEEMRAKTEEAKKDKGENTTTISSNTAVQMMIDMQKEEIEKPLDKLLNNYIK